jgi:hypothetical protein
MLNFFKAKYLFLKKKQILRIYNDLNKYLNSSIEILYKKDPKN